MERRQRKVNAKYFGDDYFHTTPLSGMSQPEELGAVGGEARLTDLREEIATIERRIASSAQPPPRKSATMDRKPQSMPRPRPSMAGLYQSARGVRPTIADLRRDSGLQNITRQAIDDLWADSEEEDTREVQTVRRGKKIKSGMDIKAADSVKKQILWPHLLLQNSYVTANLGFQDLTFSLFVAGELEILTSLLPKDASDEFVTRLEFLKALAYEANSYPIKPISEWYAAYMRRLELGHGQWGDSFYAMGQPILAKHSVQTEDKDKEVVKEPRNFVYFCSAYNRGNCEKKSPHENQIKGKSVEVEHICATCWQKNRVKKMHREGTSDCSYYKD